jgi:hypothetical protein
MSTKTQGRMPADFLELRYDSIRNISSPEDRSQDRRVYAGHMALSEILSLPTDENVRDYLVEAEGKQRRILTQVHRAILETLKHEPENFSVLNGGVVVVSRECEVDDQRKVMKLHRPSIINGSQTQGVARDFLAHRAPEDLPQLHIKFELIVMEDDALIADVSIARNFQNDVMTISIAGRKGQLEELENVMQAANAGRLRKKETQYAGDFIDTEKLIQVLTVLTPEELVPHRTDAAYAYNRKTKCLKDFQSTYVAAKSGDIKAADLYAFYLEIAPGAWALYQKWTQHSGFAGTRLRALERDNKGNIVDVPDGIVFPIIAAFSEFCSRDSGRWTISPPPRFTDDELVKAATSVYKEIAQSKPHLMGKSRACYSALRQITQIYRKLAV